MGVAQSMSATLDEYKIFDEHKVGGEEMTSTGHSLFASSYACAENRLLVLRLEHYLVYERSKSDNGV